MVVLMKFLNARELPMSLIREIDFFKPDSEVGSGFKVQFLAEYLEQEAPFVLTDEGDGRAVGLCFRMTRTSSEADELPRACTRN